MIPGWTNKWSDHFEFFKSTHFWRVESLLVVDGSITIHYFRIKLAFLIIRHGWMSPDWESALNFNNCSRYFNDLRGIRSDNDGRSYNTPTTANKFFCPTWGTHINAVLTTLNGSIRLIVAPFTPNALATTNFLQIYYHACCSTPVRSRILPRHADRFMRLRRRRMEMVCQQKQRNKGDNELTLGGSGQSSTCKCLIGDYGTWTLSLESSPWALQSSFFTVAACLVNLFTPQTMDCNNELSICPHGSITIQRSIVQL